MTMGQFTKAQMREEIEAVIDGAKDIRLDKERVDWVGAVAPGSIESRWIEAYRTTEEHYREAAIKLRNEEALQMGLAVGSQVFLIWERDASGKAVPLTLTIEGRRYVGSFTISACQARAVREGVDVRDPKVLRDLTMDQVTHIYRDEAAATTPVQLLEERQANYNELGRVLLEEFDGKFMNVLKRAKRRLYREDGEGFIQLLEKYFPRSFGDWPMAKLPQVMVLMLMDQRDAGAFDREISDLLEFEDMEELEGGADYYRPWFFVRVGVFAISDEFKNILREQKLIDSGSDKEREFRAFTIKAMRDIAGKMKGWPDSAPELEIETHAQAFLRCRRCRVGISDAELPCPYRAKCKAYNDDHELMDCNWPLVITSEF